MKIIIAGGRDFKDYTLLKIKCDNILKHITEPIEIVSGKQISYDKDLGYYGADYLGEVYAKERGFPVTPFPADWEALGKSAGIIRNEAMAKYAHALIAFWDGRSPGTKSMIELARKNGLKVRIIYY